MLFKAFLDKVLNGPLPQADDGAMVCIFIKHQLGVLAFCLQCFAMMMGDYMVFFPMQQQHWAGDFCYAALVIEFIRYKLVC